MTRKLHKIIFNLFNIDCVGCGFLMPGQIGLCRACEELIGTNYLCEKAKTVNELNFRSLYQWIPGRSDVISNLIYLLKSRLSRSAWGYIAKKFIQVHPVNMKPKIIFLPIPSSRGRMHSVYFSENLAEQLNGKSYRALKVKTNHSAMEQKARTKQERLKIQFDFDVEFTTQLDQAQQIILVDDVITTGASYTSAYNLIRALCGPEKKIELWTAFQRETIWESGC